MNHRATPLGNGEPALHSSYVPFAHSRLSSLYVSWSSTGTSKTIPPPTVPRERSHGVTRPQFGLGRITLGGTPLEVVSTP